MKPLFIHYPLCGTCRKAAKWLKDNNIEVQSRHIVENRPTQEELSKWVKKSELPIQKFFNTSGKVYKENNLKDKMKTASHEELLEILASDGKVVKRPILVTSDGVLVGFNEEEWAKKVK